MDKINIQWYPGHMAKTKRLLEANLSLVDVIIELLDARAPYSSKNPDIDTIARDKRRIIVLNKADLADEKATSLWAGHYRGMGYNAISIDSTSGKGMNNIITASKELMKDKIESQRARGRIFMPIRAMITGIPNVGKSTLINSLVGKAAAKTGDKPGVTRGKQWIKIKEDFELLDMPGILWPRFDDERVGLNLAFTGAINDEIIDKYTLSLKLIETLSAIKPEALTGRYKITCGTDVQPHVILSSIGEARGFRIKGGGIDIERTAVILLDEYRGGKLGRITLELPSAISSSS